jgi:large subunit ribosomal protein L15e
MGLYKKIREAWKKPKSKLKEIHKARLIAWKKEPAIKKIKKPTRLDRAREIGYKAKQGYIVARVRLMRGGRKRELIKKGRRSKHRRRKKIVNKSYKTVAEERAARKFSNLEVLNSYNLAKDGKYYWFEIILIDKNHPVIKKDKKINWICKNKNNRRVFRGLTSSAKKTRGLRN